LNAAEPINYSKEVLFEPVYGNEVVSELFRTVITGCAAESSDTEHLFARHQGVSCEKTGICSTWNNGRRRRIVETIIVKYHLANFPLRVTRSHSHGLGRCWTATLLQQSKQTEMDPASGQSRGKVETLTQQYQSQV